MKTKKNKTKISEVEIPEIKVVIFEEKEMLELKNINRSKIFSLIFL